MLKKSALILFILLAVAGGCLIVPLPTQASIDASQSMIGELRVPELELPEESQRCRRGELYVAKPTYYADSEIIDERCASIQEKLANAIRNGDLESMRRSLEDGAAVDSSSFGPNFSDPQRPIMVAMWERNHNAARFLLDNGVNVDEHYVCCMMSQSLLMIAVSLNDEEMTRLLIDRGASLSFLSVFESIDVFDEARRVGNPNIHAMLDAACESSIPNRVACRTRRIRKYAHELTFEV